MTMRHSEEQGKAIIETARQMMPDYFSEVCTRAARTVFHDDSTDEEGLAAIDNLIDELKAEMRRRAQ